MPSQIASRRPPWISVFETVTREIYIQTLQNQIHTEGIRSEMDQLTKDEGLDP